MQAQKAVEGSWGQWERQQHLHSKFSRLLRKPHGYHPARKHALRSAVSCRLAWDCRPECSCQAGVAPHLIPAVVLKQGSAREEKAGMEAQVLHLGRKWAR